MSGEEGSDSSGRSLTHDIDAHEISTEDHNVFEAEPARTMCTNAAYAVSILTTINLLNYIDRYLPSAVKVLIKDELHLTKTQTALPLTSFFVVYMFASPVFGFLSDGGIVPRKYLIASGVFIWSLATAASGFATSFWMLLVFRSCVGIGEAAYATISPDLISDYYPPDRRSAIMTRFNLAIPVGAALGFGLGGVLGSALGWRAAFFVCGFPGFIAAGCILTIRDPGRGVYDETKEPPVGMVDAFFILVKNRTYVVTCAGLTSVVFAVGGLADWMPYYMHEVHGVSVETAGLYIGGITVAAGIGGAVVGAVFGDYLRGKVKNPYMTVCAIGATVATLFAFIAVLSKSLGLVYASLFLCEFFLWFYTGPINALVVNTVKSSVRTRAVALNIFLQHALGDALSPAVIGAVADASSIQAAVSLVPIMLAVGALIWGVGCRFLPPDHKNAEVTEVRYETLAEMEELNTADGSLTESGDGGIDVGL